MSPKNLPDWVSSRVLLFLNRAGTPDDFQAIIDDPSDGPGRAIGTAAAGRILEARKRLPGRRFRNLQQVLDIPGVGEDKVQDLAYSLHVPADRFFSDHLERNLLPGNWHLHPYPLVFEREEQFFQTVHNTDSLAAVVAQEVERIVLERKGDPTAAFLASELLRRCPVAAADDTHQASLQLASWFYRFDADNWFPFQHMWEACQRYLEYFPEWHYRLELYFFQQFPNSGVLSDGICPRDLPVVVNFAETRITLWTSGLFD